MFCSPIYLFVDMTLWINPVYFEALAQTFQNYTNSDIDAYDCGLTSSPCESNITKALAFSAPEFVFWFDVFVVYFGIALVSFVGIVGNILNIIILSTNNIANDSTNNLFLWLSVSDAINSLQCGLLAAVCFVCFVDEGTALSVFNTVFPFMHPSINRMSLLSLDFVTVISLQRATAVIFPFKISRIFSNRNTNIIIVALISIFILTMIPIILMTPRWLYHPYHNRIISLGYIYDILDYIVVVNYSTTYFYVRSLLDLPLIFVAISLTIAKLISQNKNRSKLTNTSASSTVKSPATLSTATKASSTSTTANSIRMMKVIKMSIAVCVVSFLMFCCSIVTNTIFQRYAENVFKTPAVIATLYVNVLFNAIGASFNFFLYLVMSAQFKEHILEMLKIKQGGTD